MSAVVCTFHADRPALAYCAGCGKALCTVCVVRLSTGNYCEACAEAPTHRPGAARQGRGRVWVWAGLAVAALALYLISRVL